MKYSLFSADDLKKKKQHDDACLSQILITMKNPMVYRKRAIQSYFTETKAFQLN